MKKIICLLVALMTLLTVTSFAANTSSVSLTDIKGTKYEEAVNRLTTFKIVNGFEDNTYKPKETVTRAQLAKMLVIAMGMESKVSSASKEYLNFSDVLSSHWGYGYIKVASDNKLVNGYTDGTFKPEGNVTYAEATAMVLRALDYEVDVKRSTLSWPDNYMQYADEKLDLFDTIPAFKANDKANRGDIALLIWNALRTGVCDIVAQNDKGLVYGQGTPMITQYLNYVYIKEAEITDIEFDDHYKTAEVTLKESNKKETTLTFDAEDVLDMYGNKVTILCSKDGKDILTIETSSDYKAVKGDISRISDTRIYLTNKTTGYKIPKEDNILLYGIEDLDEAVEVILLLEDNVPEYCIAMGASDAEIGYVVDNKVKIAEDYGVKIRAVDVDKGGESFLLADEKNWPNTKDIILYYINDDDYLFVLGKVDEEKAVEISSVGKNNLKISKKQNYEFSSSDEYTVVIVNGSKLKSGKLSDIDSETDYVYVIEYNAHLYICVFPNEIEERIEDAVYKNMDELEVVMKKAKKYDEADYTQKTYARLMEALEAADKVDYNYSALKIAKVRMDLEDAIDGLVEASTKNERIIAETKKDLRKYITKEIEDIIEDEELYTQKSFDDFYDVYEEAIDILKDERASLSEIEEIQEDLETAVDKLEKKK